MAKPRSTSKRDSNGGERALVTELRRIASRPAHVEIGIGDDMAALRVGGELVLITADMLLEGVHFERGRHSLEQIGRKAMNCSLSDCAAMAAAPAGATVSFALSDDMSEADVIKLFSAMVDAGERYGCPVVGGDITSWSNPLVIDVAMMGRPASKHGVVRRDGAKAGDTIAVTGPLGGSLLRRHMDFDPRIDEARRLRDELGGRLHAMIDITDGLAIDLHRICTASGVGAALNAAALDAVVSDAARSVPDGRSPMDHVLHDGEDFELLFCVGGDPAGLAGAMVIGRITESGLTMQYSDGTARAIEPRGYEHFRASRSEPAS